MPHIRARDLRAILFCMLTSLALLLVVFVVTHGVIASVALAGAYLAWLLTRPRMRRVMRRLRGETVDFNSYYRDF